jgi:hypothetical protein
VRHVVAESSFVMPGFMPGIHVLEFQRNKAWTAGTSPAMTVLFQPQGFRPRGGGLHGRALTVAPVRWFAQA